MDAIYNGISQPCIFVLKTKSEVELHIPLREVRVDGAKEFLSQVTKALCYDLGITLKRTEPYEHAQSGKIERHHDVIDSMVRAWLQEASLPKTLWLTASQGAVYSKNRSINAFLKLEMTPYEKIYKTKLNVDSLRVYGCFAFAPIAKSKRKKLYVNAVICIFVGYSYESPGYELYDLEQGTFFTASSVDFVEDVLPGKDMVYELKDFLVQEEE